MSGGPKPVTVAGAALARPYAADVPRRNIVAELEAAVCAALDPDNGAPTKVKNAAVTRIALLPGLDRDELDPGLVTALAHANGDLWVWWADEFKPREIQRQISGAMRGAR